jgi:hypothetical protein
MQCIPLSGSIAVQIIPEYRRSGPGFDFDCFGRGTIFVEAFEGVAEFRFDGAGDAGEDGVAAGAIGDEVDEEGGKTVAVFLNVRVIIIKPIVMFTVLLAFRVSPISLDIGGFGTSRLVDPPCSRGGCSLGIQRPVARYIARL